MRIGIIGGSGLYQMAGVKIVGYVMLHAVRSSGFSLLSKLFLADIDFPDCLLHSSLHFKRQQHGQCISAATFFRKAAFWFRFTQCEAQSRELAWSQE